MATASQIQQLYIAYFGRPADPNGLASWLTSTASFTQIAQSFGTAPEFTTSFAGQTYAQQVNNIYLNTFGRQAEPTGLNSWVAELNAGRLTLAQVGLAISSGAQGSDLIALNSKITASGQWTASSNGSTAGILAYSGSAGVSAGRTFLTPVLTTVTIPTQAATDTQVQALISSSGTSGSLIFNQIVNNAILTSTINTNGLNAEIGFTPANYLLNGNDTIKIGALRGATIADSSTTDSDTLILDQVFTQSALTVAGIENLNFQGANGGFEANTLAGVKTLNFTVASRLLGGATSISTAQIFVGTTGAVAIGSALQLGGVNNIFLSAVNSGNIRLGSTTALTITNSNTGNTSYTLNQQSALGSFNFYAGSAATAFNLNYNSTAGGTFSAGVVSGGGDFTLNFGTANTYQNLSPNSASVFSFGNTGNTLVNYRAALNDNGVLNNLSVSGVNFYQIGTTAGGISTAFDARVQLKNGAISLGFGTAQTTASIIFGNALNTFVNSANLITIGTTAGTAFKASGSTDTVNLSFNTLSGSFNLSGAGFVLGTDANTALTANAGIEVLSLNIYSSTALTANHTIQAVTVATGTTTFNLNAAANVTFSISAFSAVGSGLTTLGFSQADGSNTVLVSTAWTQSRLSYFDGSGNSTISLNNLYAAQTHTALIFGFATYTQIATQINTIDISDGGLDVISLGGDSAASGFGRANVIGIGIGDVLSFTNYGGSLASVVVLTAAFSATTFSAINLWFDGVDTYVMQTTASGATTGVNFVAAILSGNYASVGRWTLNTNNLVLAN